MLNRLRQWFRHLKADRRKENITRGYSENFASILFEQLKGESLIKPMDLSRVTVTDFMPRFDPLPILRHHDNHQRKAHHTTHKRGPAKGRCRIQCTTTRERP